jgi:hypothetical protein
VECCQYRNLKCSELGCQYDDLRIFGFIDNTLNSTCRPGGGPACDGENAPRNDPDIQRAYYTGWKKMHGQKFQTVDLPNERGRSWTSLLPSNG